MDIPGFKSLRLIAQQPVALLPRGGLNTDQDKHYLIELMLENGVIMNVPITRRIHDSLLQHLTEQGTAIQQRMSARPSITPAGVSPAPPEHFLPMDRPVGLQELEVALRDTVKVPPPPSTPPEGSVPYHVNEGVGLRPFRDTPTWERCVRLGHHMKSRGQDGRCNICLSHKDIKHPEEGSVIVDPTHLKDASMPMEKITNQLDAVVGDRVTYQDLPEARGEMGLVGKSGVIKEVHVVDERGFKEVTVLFDDGQTHVCWMGHLKRE
jgi:hypothetical protein